MMADAVRDHDWLVEEFERHRRRLRAMAYRILGSGDEADDAVQEAWIRLSRSDAVVDNLAGWLTTVVARICLDMLRARSSRREQPVGADPSETYDRPIEGSHPEDVTILADAVGPALLIVLDTLSPAERLAFVLHDMFSVPFDEIGAILGRSAGATKQLASRARHKVRGTDPPTTADPIRERQVLNAFLAASRNGQFDDLVAMLDPDVVLRADTVGVRLGSPSEVRGAESVATTFSGRALGAQPALIDGAVGMVWVVGGRPKVIWEFTFAAEKVVRIDMIAAPDRLGQLDLVVLE